jgi:hypothetical protein
LALFLLPACGKKEEAAETARTPVAAPAPGETGAALPPLVAAIPAERTEELYKGAKQGKEQGTSPSWPRVAKANGGGAGGGGAGGGGAGAGAAGSSPALNADRERMRQRDAYLASLQQGSYTFNPPSPIKVAQPVPVALWVDPIKTAAELAEEMRRSLPSTTARVEAGRTAWSPRMKATLTGVDIEVTSTDCPRFDGIKDLSASARTEWGWTIVPTSPGKKQLNLVLSVILPPELGLPRELPQLVREVEVEVTVWWLIDHYWERYWKWMLGGLASAAAASIAWWWQHRGGASRQG